MKELEVKIDIYIIKRWKSLSKYVFIHILNLGFFSKIKIKYLMRKVNT